MKPRMRRHEPRCNISESEARTFVVLAKTAGTRMVRRLLIARHGRGAVLRAFDHMLRAPRTGTHVDRAPTAKERAVIRKLASQGAHAEKIRSAVPELRRYRIAAVLAEHRGRPRRERQDVDAQTIHAVLEGLRCGIPKHDLAFQLSVTGETIARIERRARRWPLGEQTLKTDRTKPYR